MSCLVTATSCVVVLYEVTSGVTVAILVVEGTVAWRVSVAVVVGVVYPSSDEQYGCRVEVTMTELAEATGHGIRGLPGFVELV